MSKLYIDQAKNEFNRVRLSAFGGHEINAFLEADIAIGMGAEWTPLFGSVESKVSSTEGVANLISTSLGQGAFSLRNQALSRVRWMRTQPLSIPLSLTFIATSKASYEDEITKPLNSLLAGIFPDVDNGVKSTVTLGATLKPPLNYDGTEKSLWKIQIGNAFRSDFYFILKDVSPVLSKQQTSEGALYAKVQVVFETYQVPTFTEVSAWFNPGKKNRVTIRS